MRDFVGHGIGRRFHEDPQVKHYGRRGTGERIKTGMTFTIEPMVNLGRFEVEVDPDDKWTVTTVDGSLSAQFEHTVVVDEDRRRGADEAPEAAPPERERRDRLRLISP